MQPLRYLQDSSPACISGALSGSYAYHRAFNRIACVPGYDYDDDAVLPRAARYKATFAGRSIMRQSQLMRPATDRPRAHTLAHRSGEFDLRPVKRARARPG